MDNRFENKDGDQNVAQGEGAVGKQDNRTSTVRQVTIGDNNISSGTGDINITTEHHYPANPASPPCFLPPQDDIFLYRETELAWLDKHLHPDKVVAVCAPGGMGKSALAARAVRRLDAARFPDGIIFHTFYHQPATAQAVLTIAHALGIKGEADLERQVALALGSKQALLILDGIEEAADLRAVLALRGSCCVLITSRKKTDAGPLRLDLQPLPGDQTEEVLRAWGGDTEDQESIERISALLGGWPVALRLAGHYLHSTGEPASDYLCWLEQEPFKELGEGEEHQAENAALLLQRSAAQVGEDSRFVLGLAGCLAFDLLAIAPMIALLEDDERRGRIAINELVNYGLLERREDRLHIGHALIHQYAASHLGLSKEALKRVSHYYIRSCEIQREASFPLKHLLRLIESLGASGLRQEVQALAEIMIYDGQSNVAKSIRCFSQAFVIARKIGDKTREVELYWKIGTAYEDLGDLVEAKEYIALAVQVAEVISHPELEKYRDGLEQVRA